MHIDQSNDVAARLGDALITHEPVVAVGSLEGKDGVDQPAFWKGRARVTPCAEVALTPDNYF